MSSAFLIDVDDVCLDWTGGFTAYMDLIGYVRTGISESWDLGQVYPNLSMHQITRSIQNYHHSRFYENMLAIPGAAAGIDALRCLYPNAIFVAVTACGTSQEVREMREHQLRDFSFDAKFLVPMGSSKEKIYRAFNKPVVIDDHVENIKAALPYSSAAILFEQSHNTWFNVEHPAFRRATHWRDVVRLLSQTGD